MLVRVVPHNPEWQQSFAQEADQLATILAANLVAIHHIGSTAIPGIYAKPIIDILVEVQDINLVDRQTSAIAQLGYEALGEFGLIGRRYFRKENSPGRRTHHVHVYQTESSEITRHLAFRDYAIAHPQIAEQYSQLKQQLAQKYPRDIEAYMDGKDEFVKRIEAQALQWRAENS